MVQWDERELALVLRNTRAIAIETIFRISAWAELLGLCFPMSHSLALAFTSLTNGLQLGMRTGVMCSGEAEIGMPNEEGQAVRVQHGTGEATSGHGTPLHIVRTHPVFKEEGFAPFTTFLTATSTRFPLVVYCGRGR
jgi:hypothetical protein